MGDTFDSSPIHVWKEPGRRSCRRPLYFTLAWPSRRPWRWSTPAKLRGAIEAAVPKGAVAVAWIEAPRTHRLEAEWISTFFGPQSPIYLSHVVALTVETGSPRSRLTSDIAAYGLAGRHLLDFRAGTAGSRAEALAALLPEVDFALGMSAAGAQLDDAEAEANRAADQYVASRQKPKSLFELLADDPPGSVTFERILDVAIIDPRNTIHDQYGHAQAINAADVSESSRDEQFWPMVREASREAAFGFPNHEAWKYHDGLTVLNLGRGKYSAMAEMESARQVEFMAICGGRKAPLDVTDDKSGTAQGFDRILIGEIPMLGIEAKFGLAGVEVKAITDSDGLRAAVNGIVVGDLAQRTMIQHKMTLYAALRGEAPEGELRTKFDWSAVKEFDHRLAKALAELLSDTDRWTALTGRLAPVMRTRYLAKLGDEIKSAYRKATFERSRASIESRLKKARRELTSLDGGTRSKRLEELEALVKDLKERRQALLDAGERNLATVLYGRVASLNPDITIPARAYALFDRVIISNLYGEVVSTHGLSAEQDAQVCWARREQGRRAFRKQLEPLLVAGKLERGLIRAVWEPKDRIDYDVDRDWETKAGRYLDSRG